MADLFDDISRLVGSQRPRRQILKQIVRLAAAGALTLFVPEHIYSAPVPCNTDNDCPSNQFYCHRNGQCYAPATVYGCCQRATTGGSTCISRTDKTSCEFCEGGTFYLGDNYTCDNARCTLGRFNPSPKRPS